jgi:hypothetical protein
MNRQEAEKLLGGYAAGTLTAAERDALLAAALEDQVLFDALVREEPLRELLQDRGVRADLLTSLGESPARRLWHWAPAGLAWSTVAAVVILTVLLVRRDIREREPVVVAETPQQIDVVSKMDHVAPKPFVPEFPKSEPKLTSPLPPPPVIAMNMRPATAILPPTNLPVMDKRAEAPSAPPAAAEAVAEAEKSQISAAPAAGLVGAVSGGGGAAVQSFRPQPLAAANQLGRVAENLEVRYTILKKTGDSETEVDPKQELERKDEVRVRLTPNETGYLYVLWRNRNGEWGLLAGERVSASVPYTVPRTGTLRVTGAGPMEFRVLFSRFPQVIDARSITAVGGVQSAANGQARFSSIVQTNAGSNDQQISFPITLQYK